MRGRKDITVEQYMEHYIVPEPNSGCWLWAGCHDPDGYGRWGYRGQCQAHRAVYVHHVGAIPEGLHALHKCDTPACVNPDHLYLGTSKENQRDVSLRNRHGRRGYATAHYWAARKGLPRNSPSKAY